MSPKPEVKKAQLEYQREAFKVLHDYFHNKNKGSVPDFSGDFFDVEQTFEAVKHRVVIREDLFSAEKRIIFMEQELNTLQTESGLYFRPKDVCDHMGITAIGQIKTISENKVLEKQYLIDDATGDLWLDLSYFNYWIAHIH